MRSSSLALDNFKNSIAIAETLLAREKRFGDPPHPKNKKIIEGLRGGALVLMVASFENYLKDVMEERLSELSTSPQFNFNSLPTNIVHHNYRQTFHNSLFPLTKLDDLNQKIVRYEKASQFIINRQINPEAFSVSIRGNPNSERLTEFFNSIGYTKFFIRVKPKFEKKIGTPVAPTYIKDTLNFILKERHQVAHKGRALNLSRRELGEYIIFLKTLSEICDNELYYKIKSLDK